MFTVLLFLVVVNSMRNDTVDNEFIVISLIFIFLLGLIFFSRLIIFVRIVGVLIIVLLNQFTVISGALLLVRSDSLDLPVINFQCDCVEDISRIRHLLFVVISDELSSW